MKHLFWITPLVLSASFVLPACNDSRKSGDPISENRSGAIKMSDSDLENAIRTKFDSDQQLKEANLSVSADIDENKATISGTVASQNVRTKAIELARAVQPGLTIEDKIDVKPAG
jgi:osmotically-inducible protein OsmY